METCLPSSKKEKKAQILDLRGTGKRKKKNLTIDASSSRAVGRKLWEETEEIKKQWHVKKTFPHSPSNRYSDFVVYKF